MRTGLAVGLVVFAGTFVTNVVIVAVWPDNEVDWAASVIVAATTAVFLTFHFRRSVSNTERTFDAPAASVVGSAGPSRT